MRRCRCITPAHPSAFAVAPHLLPCWHKLQQPRKKLRMNSGNQLPASPLSASLSASQLFDHSDQQLSGHSNDPLLQDVHTNAANDGDESFVPGKHVPSLSSKQSEKLEQSSSEHTVSAASNGSRDQKKVQKLEARIRDLEKALYKLLQESASERARRIQEMRDHQAALAAADQQKQEALASAEKRYREASAFTEQRLKNLESHYDALVTQMMGKLSQVVSSRSLSQ